MTGVVVVLALVILRAVPGMREALAGLADFVAYFLRGTGHLSAPEIFRFGIWMTLLAAVVVLTGALP